MFGNCTPEQMNQFRQFANGFGVTNEQLNGTLLDKKGFVLWYLDNNYTKVLEVPERVENVARLYPNNIVLCTMKGHICCIKYGVIYDTFDPSKRLVEGVWIVK